MAVLREFGPLIAAIVTAASARSYCYDEMKVNLEVDALETMGRLHDNTGLAASVCDVHRVAIVNGG